MKKTTLAGIITAISIGAISVSSVAYARGDNDGAHRGPRGPQFNFEELDLNDDGKITPEEMAEHRAMMFAASDADENGLLSAEEMVAAAINRAKDGMENRVERMMERRDTDGDGQISMAEMNGNDDRASKLFERLDTDKDGAISSEEMDAMKDRPGKGKKGWGHGKRHHKQND